MLALGGLQGRKLRWLGGGQPSSVSHPPRLSLVSPSPIPPPPPPLPSFTPCVDVAASAATPGCDSGAAPPPPSPQTVEEPAGGVTNQRLAIVNSTCAVKQLINKRLFTSCARSCFTRFIIIRVPRNEWRRGKRLAAFFAARRTLVGGTLRIVRIGERRRDFVNKWVRK